MNLLKLSLVRSFNFLFDVNFLNVNAGFYLLPPLAHAIAHVGLEPKPKGHHRITDAEGGGNITILIEGRITNADRNKIQIQMLTNA